MHGLIFETSICYWQDQPDICGRSIGKRREAGLQSSSVPTPFSNTLALFQQQTFQKTQSLVRAVATAVNRPTYAQIFGHNFTVLSTRRLDSEANNTPNVRDTGPRHTFPPWQEPPRALLSHLEPTCFGPPTFILNEGTSPIGEKYAERTGHGLHWNSQLQAHHLK